MGRCHVEKIVSDVGTAYDVRCARCGLCGYLGYRAHARRTRAVWNTLSENIRVWNMLWDSDTDLAKQRVGANVAWWYRPADRAERAHVRRGCR